MGNSSTKVPEYEIVDHQASTSDAPRPSTGSASASSQGGLGQPPPNLLNPQQQWAPVQQGAPPPLPNGWDFHIDPATGYPYFYNTGTRVSQWQDPRGPGFSLPSRSNAINLGERRQVIPPWEGGPANADPLSWPLPPGWQEQHDQATNQRYYVNYDARIVSQTDPRLEIAKAYSQGPIVVGVPVHYPPPVIGRPVDELPTATSSSSAQGPFGPGQGQGPPPQTWSGPHHGGGGTSSYPPPPPPLKRKKKNSLWSKLGYRQGMGGRGGSGGVPLPLFLFGDLGFAERGAESSDDNSDDDTGFGFPGGASSSSSSSSSSSLSEDDDGDGNDTRSEGGDFSLGEQGFPSDGGSGALMSGVGGTGGVGLDLAAVNEYGDAGDDGGGGGNSGENLGNVNSSGGGGGNVSGVYQQPLFGFWQSFAKDVYFHGLDDGLKQLLPQGRRFYKLDRYTNILIVLAILVASYCGVFEGLLFSLFFAFSGRLIAFMWKSGKIVTRLQKRSGRRFFGRIRLAFKKSSTLVRIKTAALSRRTQIMVWFYEHLYQHPVVRIRVLTDQDEASPLHSKLHTRSRDITIVTQASVDRIPAIEAMAKSWGGIMCVAVHVRTQAELKQVYPRLRSLHARIEAQGICRLNICVAQEEGLSSNEETMTSLYPINAMRNLALSMATTELVFILDADFVPSLGMHELLTGDETAYSEILKLATTKRQMLVIPAFEARNQYTGGLDISKLSYPTQIHELREQWKGGSAMAFHSSHFPRGHNPTDYESFFKLTAKPYSVQYREFYEPYTICGRRIIPRFDARFRGYGMNKISHAYHCSATGMEFSILPQVFIWSLPHQKSHSWMQTFGRGQDPLQKLRILGLYRRFKSELELRHRRRKMATDEGTFPQLLEIKIEVGLPLSPVHRRLHY